MHTITHKSAIPNNPYPDARKNPYIYPLKKLNFHHCQPIEITRPNKPNSILPTKGWRCAIAAIASKTSICDVSLQVIDLTSGTSSLHSFSSCRPAAPPSTFNPRSLPQSPCFDHAAAVGPLHMSETHLGHHSPSSSSPHGSVAGKAVFMLIPPCPPPSL